MDALLTIYNFLRSWLIGGVPGILNYPYSSKECPRIIQGDDILKRRRIIQFNEFETMPSQDYSDSSAFRPTD